MTMPPLSTFPVPGEHVQDRLQNGVLRFESEYVETCGRPAPRGSKISSSSYAAAFAFGFGLVQCRLA